MFAVQLAKVFVVHVTAVCGKGNAAIIKELGADRVIDYAGENYLDGGTKYDFIAAVNGKHTLSEYRRALGTGGILVVVGGALSQLFGAMLFGRFQRGMKTGVLTTKPNAEGLEYLAELVRTQKIRCAIDRRYKLNEAAEAIAYLAEGHAHGKVIITVREED